MVHDAPASRRSTQIATSASSRAAHEFGGGDAGLASPSAPATIGDAAAFEGDDGDVGRPQHGEVRLDHLVGCGQVEPDLEQLGGVWLDRVDQREHLAVHDAGTGGQPLRVAAAEAGRRTQRIGMVDQPLRTSVTVSKPRCGCCGKPGTSSPWYIRQPSRGSKSDPISRPASDSAGGPNRPLPRGTGRGGGRRTGTGRPSATGTPAAPPATQDRSCRQG